uniref:polysaccharide pyruvyl transferase family protein n=1 Tax=Flavobacterium sp. TaxID=239 RepID=UPI00404B88D9
MINKKIILLGASLENDNKGVNALGIGAITLLKNNFQNAEISLLCVGEPGLKNKTLTVSNSIINVKLYYFSKYDILKSIGEAYLYRVFKLKPKLDVSKLILENDIAFDINEGDSFSDIYGSKRIIRHFTDSKLVLCWKKPLIFLPQTIGPFNTTLGKTLGSHILKRLNKLYVRDEKAFKFIEQLGLQKELAIDMAVYMTPKKVDFNVNTNTIGINVSGLMYMNRYKTLEGAYDNYVSFLHKLISKLLSANYNVLLIPHTYNSKTPNEEDDLGGILKFIKEFPEFKNKIKYVDKDYSAQELKHIISQTIFFLGSRMHSCIAALSTSVPTIGLSYSYKFEGTFKMFNQIKYVEDINYLKEENISTLIDTIFLAIENKEEIKNTLLRENNRQQLSFKNLEI